MHTGSLRENQQKWVDMNIVDGEDQLGDRYVVVIQYANISCKENDTSTLAVEGLMIKPCGLTSASVVVELFPLESFNVEVCSSIHWVARHMIEMCALEDEYLTCINGETLDTL